MSTDAFNRFQAHLRVTGQAYGDGFLIADFKRMTLEEFAEAKVILIERAKKGDNVCLWALEHIMPSDEFSDFSELLLERSRGMRPSFHAEMLTTIFKRSPRENVWTGILEVLKGPDPFARNRIMNHIAVEDLSESRKTQMADLMTKMILHPPEKGFLFYTAGGLLDSLGVVPRTPDYINYAARLKNPDPRERKIALIELGCLKPE